MFTDTIAAEHKKCLEIAAKLGMLAFVGDATHNLAQAWRDRVLNVLACDRTRIEMIDDANRYSGQYVVAGWQKRR